MKKEEKIRTDLTPRLEGDPTIEVADSILSRMEPKKKKKNRKKGKRVNRKIRYANEPGKEIHGPKKVPGSPVQQYKHSLIDGENLSYVNRIAVGTATTGLVRMEWVMSRYGQSIPMNWSQVMMTEFFSPTLPLKFKVADAQNIIVQRTLDAGFEWLLLWEHDVLAPEDALHKLDVYMRHQKTPVVSGLYYSRWRPSEPLIFMDRGIGCYDDFEIGDKVWCKGVPTGFLLIHCGLLKKMWEDSPEYIVKNHVVRRVFRSPQYSVHDKEHSVYSTLSGTSDLDWCQRVIDGDYFKKAGWKKIAKKEYPFLVDTGIFCRHIDNQSGEIFP